jgi:hypothetical protein
MSFSTQVSAAVTSTISVGNSTTVNLGIPGQSEILGFTATTGENVTVNVSGVTTVPANTPVSVYVYNSAHNVVSNPVTNTTTTTGTTINLTNLAADTYRIFVSPQTPATVSLQVAL